MNTNNANIKIITCKLLTIGGDQLWEEDNTLNITTDILQVNDIYSRTITSSDKKLWLCEVDANKTNIADFYKWEEISLEDKDTFCWRSFIYILDKNGNSWLDIPEEECLGPYKVKNIISEMISRTITPLQTK